MKNSDPNENFVDEFDASAKYIIVRPHYSEGNETDLAQLFKIIWQEKNIFLSFVIVCVFSAVIVVLLSTRIYEAEVVVAPASFNSGQPNFGSLIGPLSGLPQIDSLLSSSTTNTILAKRMLLSRNFAIQFIEKYDLMPLLFHAMWDGSNKRWLGNTPSFGQAYNLYRRMINIDEEVGTGILTIVIEWHDPVLAAEWVNNLVAEINEKIQLRDIEAAQDNLEYLTITIQEVQVLEMQQVLYNLVEAETQKIMLANVRDNYVFTIIDPAVPPENPVKPNARMILLLGIIIGIFAGSILSIYTAKYKQR